MIYYIFCKSRNRFWRQNRMGYTMDHEQIGSWHEDRLPDNLDDDDELVPTSEFDARWREMVIDEAMRLQNE